MDVDYYTRDYALGHMEVGPVNELKQDVRWRIYFQSVNDFIYGDYQSFKEVDYLTSEFKDGQINRQVLGQVSRHASKDKRLERWTKGLYLHYRSKIFN